MTQRLFIPLTVTAFALFAMTGCTSNPIEPITDFDFFFEEIQEVDLGVDVDTAAVEIPYKEVEEDTTYIETQSGFLTDAQNAPQSGRVPSSVVDAAEAARAAFDASTEDQLDAMDEAAAQDPSAFAENLEADLEDSTSATSTFAEQITDLAQQQADLADLLGISESATTLARAPRRLPFLDTDRTDRPTIHFSAQNGCEADARNQTQAKLSQIRRDAVNRRAALDRALAQGKVDAETFRVRELASLVAKRNLRRARAVEFYLSAAAAVNALVQNKLITQVTASNLRRVNMTIVITRLRRSHRLHRRAIAAVEVAARAAVALAEAKHRDQLARLDSSLQKAELTLQQLQLRAEDDCHDQGVSVG